MNTQISKKNIFILGVLTGMAVSILGFMAYEKFYAPKSGIVLNTSNAGVGGENITTSNAGTNAPSTGSNAGIGERSSTGSNTGANSDGSH
jgi:hypothetical protein